MSQDSIVTAQEIPFPEALGLRGIGQRCRAKEGWQWRGGEVEVEDVRSVKKKALHEDSREWDEQ